MKKNLLLGLVTGLFLICMSDEASATIIFSDDFNRPNSNIVGNGWLEDQNSNNDVRIKDGYLILRDESSGIDAAILQGVQTVGYENIHLDFDYRSHNGNSESGDKLKVAWDLNDNNWQDIWSHGLGSATDDYATINLDFLSIADNQSNFRLRFWTNVNDSTEGANIDNVVLRGTLAPVPEPTTMLLFGTGLIGLAGISRKKKK